MWSNHCLYPLHECPWGGARGGFRELGWENLIFELFGKSSFQKNRSQELKTKTKIPNRTFKKSFFEKNNILREKSSKIISFWLMQMLFFLVRLEVFVFVCSSWDLFRTGSKKLKNEVLVPNTPNSPRELRRSGSQRKSAMKLHNEININTFQLQTYISTPTFFLTKV